MILDRPNEVFSCVVFYSKPQVYRIRLTHCNVLHSGEVSCNITIKVNKIFNIIRDLLC